MKAIAVLIQYAFAILPIMLMLASGPVSAQSPGFKIGTASFKKGALNSPACGGADSNGFVAGVPKEIFQDGAACGHTYDLYCINDANTVYPCTIAGAKATVRIVDLCVDDKQGKCTTFVLPRQAFAQIAKPGAGIVKVSYQRVQG